MIEDATYDWRLVALPDDFEWSETGVWTDCAGNPFTIGASVELMRSTIAFDEKGGSQGIWDINRVVEIIAASAEFNVVFFEGAMGQGWASGAIPADNVKVIAEAGISNAPNQ